MARNARETRVTCETRAAFEKCAVGDDSGHDGLPLQKGSQQLRRCNRSNLLHLLRQRSLTRSELSVASGLTGAAVSRITRELLKVNLLIEKKSFHKPAGAGRRSVSLAINPQGVFVVGVTITANRLSVAISNCAGGIVKQREVRLTNTRNPTKVLERLVSATRELLEQGQIHRCKSQYSVADTERASPQPVTKDLSFHRSRLAGIGISMAVSSGDVIERTDGSQAFVSSRALGWTSVDVASPFAHAFNLPVEVEPRAVAILRSEASKALSKANQPVASSEEDVSADTGRLTITGNVFLVNVGLGLGTATRVERNIYGCSSNRVGDLTHLAHPDSTLLCECGRRGCLQHVATGAAVVHDIAAAYGIGSEKHQRGECSNTQAAGSSYKSTNARKASDCQLIGEVSANALSESAMPANTLSQTTALSELNPGLDYALQLADAGNTVAAQAFFNAGVRLAFGLDLVHALLDPDQIVLAGAVGRQRDYVAGVRHGLAQYRTPLQHHQLRVSQYTSSVAAVSIGLEAFVYSDRLDLSRLGLPQPDLSRAEDDKSSAQQSHSDPIPEVV
jgi:predicted NBD/HSP70 family sugar kinase